MILESLENVKIPQNHVIVKLPDTYKMMLNNEVSIRGISIKTHFEPATHAPRYGTVAVVPEKLVFGVGGMGWKTDMEVQAGDTVWFNYLICLMALGKLLNPHYTNPEKNYIIVGEDIYVILPYEGLIVAKRGGDVICLNSYVIGEQQYEAQSNIIITEPKKTGWVKVLHFGNPVTEYFNDSVETEDISVNDIVLINKKLAEKLENGLTNTFDKRELIFFQRRQIYAKKMLN
jgi:hypothetical protein